MILSQDRFLSMVRGFRVSAFRFEQEDRYRFPYEEEELARFLQGRPRTPDQVSWWHPWLTRVRQCAAEGKTVSRVRVLAEPPSDYQRWLIWGTRFHAGAGEDIRYLPRSRAGDFPGHDWWLLDDVNLIEMRFADGQLDRTVLITDGGTVARYRAFRDLALSRTSQVITEGAAFGSTA